MTGATGNALVTGGSAGIGAAVAETLALRGMSVTIAARNAAVAEQTADRIGRATGTPVAAIPADLSLMTAVGDLAEAFLAANDGLDVLVHSAGGMHPDRVVTGEGVELTWATHVLGRRYLDELLIGSMAGRDAGIVHISGGGAVRKDLDVENLQGERRYSAVGAINTISIANDVLAAEVAARHPGVRSYAYGPGPVRGTGLTAQMRAPVRAAVAVLSRVKGSTIDAAAADVVALATGSLPSGLYQRRLKRIDPTTYVASGSERRAIWDIADRQTSACLA